MFLIELRIRILAITGPGRGWPVVVGFRVAGIRGNIGRLVGLIRLILRPVGLVRLILRSVGLIRLIHGAGRAGAIGIVQLRGRLLIRAVCRTWAIGIALLLHRAVRLLVPWWCLSDRGSHLDVGTRHLSVLLLLHLVQLRDRGRPAAIGLH